MRKVNKGSNASIAIPHSERLARLWARRLETFLQKKRGRYLLDDKGSLHVVIDEHRICLSCNRENNSLARLMLEACGVSTLSTAAQAAIQRIQVSASARANLIRYRKFSALSDDGTGLYIPLHSGQLLRVTADEINMAANGDNADSLWVERKR